MSCRSPSTGSNENTSRPPGGRPRAAGQRRGRRGRAAVRQRRGGRGLGDRGEPPLRPPPRVGAQPPGPPGPPAPAAAPLRGLLAAPHPGLPSPRHAPGSPRASPAAPPPGAREPLPAGPAHFPSGRRGRRAGAGGPGRGGGAGPASAAPWRPVGRAGGRTWRASAPETGVPARAAGPHPRGRGGRGGARRRSSPRSQRPGSGGAGMRAHTAQGPRHFQGPSASNGCHDNCRKLTFSAYGSGGQKLARSRSCNAPPVSVVTPARPAATSYDL
ncbi:collagen alpha-1(III) chain-like [Hippopotamus amphibius kiboko]|uniref:collagen alpha-1(III) chain-like n=1 Tax=Hippopotamus amphibius kiboko TaxID=575201 RepID=UPI0025924390|nr:collagen alpha-1(III) chain-like [Hippopotamus amphibius kiboko]